MRLTILTLVIVALYNLSLAQQYPIYILPGQQVTVKAEADTLWIITDSQFEKALTAAKELENADKQILNYQRQIENLQQQIAQRDSIIDLIKKNKDFYESSWKQCKDDIQYLAQLNDKQAVKIKIIIITGIVTTISAFLLGVFLKI